MIRSVLCVAVGAWMLAVHASLAALPPENMRAAAAYSAAHGGASFLGLENGKTLLEEYHGEASREGSLRIYSGTKAFWNLAALAAAEDRLLSLDERVADTIPAWQSDSRKSRITIRQLLDFSCGLDPGFFLHNDDRHDRDAAAIALPGVAEPGTAFIYGPSALQVFHEVLKAKLRGENPQRYLERRVLHRLGLGAQRYLPDRAGNPLLASGWYLSARQWARLGQLALAHGAPVMSANSFGETTRGSSANRAFAFGWWNNRAAPGGREFDFEAALHPKWSQQSWQEACICRDAPSDLVACIGSGYQRLYVIPSLQLVVVRHGNGGRFSDAQFLRLLLARRG